MESPISRAVHSAWGARLTPWWCVCTSGTASSSLPVILLVVVAYPPAWIMFFMNLQPRKSRVGSTIARGKSTGLRVARWICRCVAPSKVLLVGGYCSVVVFLLLTFLLPCALMSLLILQVQLVDEVLQIAGRCCTLGPCR